MPRYKYPAPFDQEGPPLDLLRIHNAPVPPCPPLLVNIFVDKPKTTPPSLYRDVMGDDLSLLYMALDAPWASDDQHVLAEQIADGRKDLNSLSTTERELLDSLVHSYNDYVEPIPELPLPPIPEPEEVEEELEDEDPEDEEPEDDSPEPSEEITKAYD